MQNINVGIVCKNIKKEKLKASDKIIKRIEKNRKMALILYKKYYISCLEEIKKANKSGKTEIIFEIDRDNIINTEYCPNKCIGYITNKLSEEFMDILKISDTQLFISWQFIELNKLNYK